MKYLKLGRTGLDISRLGLGCMNFGAKSRGGPAWTLGESESLALIREALEAGINFFDTANIYANGSSEEILGKALATYSRRDEVVVATKVGGPTREGPNGRGLNRNAIFQEVDASLQQPKTDYIDLYQIHHFDPGTPAQETMGALHDVVRAGKARYMGASTMFAWQFAKMLNVATSNKLTPFVSMQNHQNLLYREEEREMLPLCRDAGVGVTPWSPLARGRFARAEAVETRRSATDQTASDIYDDGKRAERAIINAVYVIAKSSQASSAQVVLAWVLSKSEVSALIVGVTHSARLKEAVGALAMELSPNDIDRLESPYLDRPLKAMSWQYPGEDEDLKRNAR